MMLENRGRSLGSNIYWMVLKQDKQRVQLLDQGLGGTCRG